MSAGPMSPLFFVSIPQRSDFNLAFCRRRGFSDAFQSRNGLILTLKRGAQIDPDLVLFQSRNGLILTSNLLFLDLVYTPFQSRNGLILTKPNEPKTPSVFATQTAPRNSGKRELAIGIQQNPITCPWYK